MKPGERSKRIKEAKHWFQRLWLARDLMPGHAVDTKIYTVHQYYPDIEKYRKNLKKQLKSNSLADLKKPDPLAQDMLARIGQELIEAIATDNSVLFFQYASAIEAHRKHQPSPDKLRAAIIEFCVPPDKKYSVKEILKHLRNHHIQEIKGYEDHGLQTQIRRICRENKITIEGQSGRPTKNYYTHP